MKETDEIVHLLRCGGEVDPCKVATLIERLAHDLRITKAALKSCSRDEMAQRQRIAELDDRNKEIGSAFQKGQQRIAELEGKT